MGWEVCLDCLPSFESFFWNVGFKLMLERQEYHVKITANVGNYSCPVLKSDSSCGHLSLRAIAKERIRLGGQKTRGKVMSPEIYGTENMYDKFKIPWAHGQELKFRVLGRDLFGYILLLTCWNLSTRGYKKKVACLDFSVKVLLVMDSFEPNRCDVCEDGKITILCCP